MPLTELGPLLGGSDFRIVIVLCGDSFPLSKQKLLARCMRPDGLSCAEVLFRGLPAPREPNELSEIVTQLHELGRPKEYVGGGTSKTHRAPFVRTASDEPASQTMEP